MRIDGVIIDDDIESALQDIQSAPGGWNKRKVILQRQKNKWLGIATTGIICPFCGQDDFDKIGLKYHLENHCSEYQNTSGI